MRLLILAALTAALVVPAIAQDVTGQEQNFFETSEQPVLTPAYAAVGPRVSLDEHLPAVQGLDRDDRRQYAVDLLKSTAEWSQAPLLGFLREQEALGNARIRRIIWLNNVVSFDATQEVIDLAATIENVLYVRLDRTPAIEDVADGGHVENVMPMPRENSGAAVAATVPPNITRINADDVWALGYRGEGVTVCIVDSRFNYNHPDLVDHQWVNTAETVNGIDDDGNGYIDDTIGWDFGSDDAAPFTTSNNTSSDGHGTRVAGTVLGDGTQGTCTGIAPEALGMYCSISGAPESDWWAAYQYAVDEGADVIDSSFSLKWPSTPDYAGFRQATDMELLAGVIHANSIGNQGNLSGSSHPIPFNVSTPGNCPSPWRSPDQAASGGLSAVMGCGALASATSNSISSSSGIGPSVWNQSDADATFGGTYPNPFSPYSDYFLSSNGLLKPDVCAPSNSGMVTTSNDYLNGSSGVYYNGFGGTSGATPHLGGMMALLLSVDRQLTPEELARIISLSSTDLGVAGKDNNFGEGVIDCLAAANMIFDERGGLRADDYVMITSSGTITHVRSGGSPFSVLPQVIGSGTLPTSWGNGSIEHIDNSACFLAGSGAGDLWLLDLSDSSVYPDAFFLDNVGSSIVDIEFDRFSGNAYLALGNGDIKAINGPITPASFVSIGDFASGTPMTAGIAVASTGTELLGADAGTVYRICPQGSPQPLFTITLGANGIDVDHNTGDIFVNSFGSDLVARYDSAGNFIENVLDSTYVNGPDDVELHPRTNRVYTVGRHNAAGSLCIFGGCIAIPVGEQFGNDNVIVGGVQNNGGQVMAAVPTVYPNRNTGSTANLAIAGSALYDGAFAHQVAGEAVRGSWVDDDASAMVQPGTCSSTDAGFPKTGSNWLDISANLSNDATPPSTGVAPVGATEVTTYVAFDANRPMLRFDVGFVNAEGVGSSFADFGGAFVEFEGQVVNLVTLDVNSVHGTNSTCYGDPVATAAANVDLRSIFPGILTGEIFELVFYVGNDQDSSFDSHLYVDDVRLESAGVRLDVTTPTPGSFQVDVSGAVPNATLLTMLTLTPNCPRGAGPAAGLHGSAFEVISFFAPPIWANADAAGNYTWGVPGIPPGLFFEFVCIEFAGPFNSVSNIGGPILF